MSDWNPAEMIGQFPSRLSHSLYSNLITDEQSSLEKVKNSKGEFDIVTPKRVQRKRDKLALRNQINLQVQLQSISYYDLLQ